ncbi:bis(5'-nucleosyl)-tetraphosphatase (symmetrical) YqeK [Amphibacillus cookii]|uniref:bis(5'-nucleosyl)-tetraphosphatase (symmetrical) YqeK n=1 Tax=Amphibacillus cookii TaxID=767787 RepID=UPI00195DE5EB|nr:bis(5'-nucleosyl)-tetraphosphatase (symmetrical) YqeK [Amphibacillus cookii]MBM7541698.1 putative HD superfamily hydrolase involved in NAD metabolism [Amphibacillus cookii]
MDKSSALKAVKPHLTASRFAHTERVTETALILADRFEVDKGETVLAAIFHDYAKYRDLDEMAQIIRKHQLPNDLLSYHHELWHGPVASILVETELNINNPAVKEAIYWHTTGHASMTKLEKIIYLADYIEPGRDFEGLDAVRKQAESNLNEACFMAVRNGMRFLLENERLIYPETLNMYNDLKRKLEESNS